LVAARKRPSSLGSDTEGAQFDRITAAAISEFEQYGIGRASMENIARMARCSRSSLYRHFPNKRALLAHTMGASLNELVATMEQAVQGCDANGAVVEAFIAAIRFAHSSTLISRIVESDGNDVILDIKFIDWLAEEIAGALRRAGAPQDDTQLRAICELMVRIAATFVLAPSTRLIDLDDEASVRKFAENYLIGMINM
jgi:AcrR family transcriptional regulator